MTVLQLISLCKRHGHRLYVFDGVPRYKPFRAGDVLPDDVRELLFENRDLIINWFQKNVRQDWEACAVCQANVSISLTPDDAATICPRVPVYHKDRPKWNRPGCPYRNFQGDWRCG